MKSALPILMCLCFVKSSFGSCRFRIFSDRTTSCIAPNGATIPVGAELKIPENCEHCACALDTTGTSTTMRCCGYGKNAGAFMVPEGCKKLIGDDGCSLKFVQIADETLSCFG